jgi:membrane protein
MSMSRKAVLVETFKAAGQNHLGLLAAGVAFYMFFAIIPALGVAVSLLGLLTDPAAIQEEVGNLRDVLPQEALGLIQQQVIALTSQRSTGLSLAGLINLVIALFTARTAASSMVEALNYVHGLEETRGIIKVNAIAVLFTIVAVITLVAAIMLVVLMPGLLSFAGSSGTRQLLVHYLRWPLLAILAILALAIVYRFGPDREKPGWR